MYTYWRDNSSQRNYCKTNIDNCFQTLEES